MNEGSYLIADVEALDSGELDFVSVTIGVIGHSTTALVVYRDDWAAFKELVAEIDAEWTT